MTRRPRKSRTARKAPRRKAAKPVPLDGLIKESARAFGIEIEKAWIPSIRTNLQVTLRLGAFVAAFALDDDAEPAPVFEP